MLLLDPRNGPAYDLPPWDGPVRPYVIASVPRCGSTLLARALWDTGRVGAPKEYLNPMQIRDFEVRFGGLGRRMRHLPLRGPALGLVGRAGWDEARVRTGAGGWWGLKLHWHHHQQRVLDLDLDLDALLGGPVRWIRVRRDDRLGQAISWARAVQTGKWADWQRGWAPPVYSRRGIDRAVARIEAHEAAWAAWLAGRQVLEVSYEALAADLEGELRRSLRHVGAPHDGPLPPPALARQADAVSERWRARYAARLGPQD